MLVSLAIALAAAIIVMTWVQTGDQYRTLPDRVPLHMDLNGTVDLWGPRFAIWMLPAVQLACAGIMAFAGYAISVGAANTHGSVRGVAFFAPCMLALLWRAQVLLISIAKSGEERVPMGSFWIFFAAAFGAAMLSAIFL